MEKQYKKLLLIKNCISKEYFFKPTKWNNYYRPLINQKDGQTDYQYAVEIFNYKDIRLYCDHIPKDKILFSHKPLHYKLMAHKDSDIQTIKTFIERKNNVREQPLEEKNVVIVFMVLVL